jgi:hypothetical protein
LWNIESLSLYLDAANTALPCHDSLWDASTSTTWAALFPSSNSVLPPPSLTLSRAIQLVCASSVTASAALAPILRDSFALTTVLSVLNALEWARGHAKTVEKTFLTPAPPAPFAGVKVEPVVNGKDSELGVEDKALEAGLNFFLDKVLAVDPQQQNSTGNTMALLIHLTALNQYLPLRVLQVRSSFSFLPSPELTSLCLFPHSLSPVLLSLLFLLRPSLPSVHGQQRRTALSLAPPPTTLDSSSLFVALPPTLFPRPPLEKDLSSPSRPSMQPLPSSPL